MTPENDPNDLTPDSDAELSADPESAEVPAPLSMKVLLTAAPFVVLFLLWMFHRWFGTG